MARKRNWKRGAFECALVKSAEAARHISEYHRSQSATVNLRVLLGLSRSDSSANAGVDLREKNFSDQALEELESKVGCKNIEQFIADGLAYYGKAE